MMVMTFCYLFAGAATGAVAYQSQQRRSLLPLVAPGDRPSRVVQPMALWSRRPNSALKRTHTGGRQLWIHRAFIAPVCAA